jgi:hypothetical protein
MPWTFPAGFQNPHNRPALACLAHLTAHSDVVEALTAAVEPLGDVQLHCPDRRSCACVLAVTRNVLFAAAHGMSMVGFRLDQRMRERALASGGARWPECGGDWVSFQLFRDDWPRVDLEFWARKAYVTARELAG